MVYLSIPDLKYVQWLSKSSTKISSSDGVPIELWELNHQHDDTILSEWAKHFRNHYCLDSMIDCLRDGTGLSRRDYLISLIFPDNKEDFGPITRSGDFGEIIVADWLEYLKNYWVPRSRYANKATRNESVKGSDVIGIKFHSQGSFSVKDELTICEVKAKLRSTNSDNPIQRAIDDSIKDNERIGLSLNALKRHLIEDNLDSEADKVKRFQNPIKSPYKKTFNAVAVFSNSTYSDEFVHNASVVAHPNSEHLHIIVIKGENLMELVHHLYGRAADEA